MTRLIAVAVVALVLLGALVLSQRRTEPFHVSGFVEAYEIRIGSRVGGRVQKVLVEEGQTVSAGEALVVLEPFQLTEQRAEAAAKLAEAVAECAKINAGLRPQEIAQAEARYDQLKASLDELEKGPREEDIAAAQAQIELAQAILELAKINQKRTSELLGKGKTPQDLDQANSDLRVAQATLRAREEEHLKLKRGTRAEEKAQAAAKLEEAKQAWDLARLGSREEDKAHAQAAVEAAQAALAAIDTQIEELTIKATVAGSIEAVDLRPGDLVGAGTPAVSLLDTGSLWVRAYVPENRLNVKIGQQVVLTVDSYPGRRFQGKISFIARQAEFTPGNVQTPEDRSKQVFRIKVDVTSGRDVVRPGMVADVWFDPQTAPGN